MTKRSQALNIFVEKLIEEKNFENINPETMEQIRADLLKRVEDKINVTILQHVPSEKLEDFNKLLDNPDEEKIHKFCSENISNLDEIIAETLMNFRSIYLNA